MNKRKKEIAAYFDSVASSRDTWKSQNRYYYACLEKLCTSLILPGRVVLEIGCGTGDLLAAIKPSRGIGIDLSLEMVKIAKNKYPQYTFIVGDAENLCLSEKFDYVIMSDLIGHLQDIWQALQEVHRIAHSETKLLITYYNFVWEPVLRLGENLGWKMPQGYQNWLGKHDINNLLYLTNFNIQKERVGILLPKHIPFLSNLVNRYLASWPLFKWACLLQYFVAQPSSALTINNELSCSVIVPSRNERDNIEACVRRIPQMGRHTEIIFVDGASTDGTEEKIREMIKQYSDRKDIKLIQQVSRDKEDKPHLTVTSSSKVEMLPLGKGDAVRKGFEKAKGEILMILDSDLTVSPEDLPKFYVPLAEGKAGFVNGSRLVYPIENEAMPIINYIGNKFFSWFFSWLLAQSIKDTLCGTKALLRKDYERIKQARAYFGNFDPFGDFDLLFGAAREKLKIVEVPVAYKRRSSGYSKVQVYKHGFLLIKMSLVAFRKFKLNQWLKRK